ncbi:MAG: hypothetical protein WCQ32_02910 [bacterium]
MKALRIVALSILCIVAIVYLAWWAQVVIFVAAVFLSTTSIVFLLLAAISDSIFGPHNGFHFASLFLFWIVLGSVLLRWVLLRYTRLGNLYDEKKD